MSNDRGYNNDTAESIVIETDKLIAAEGNTLFKEIDTSFQNQQPDFGMFMESTGADFPLAQSDDNDAGYEVADANDNSINLSNDFNDNTENTIMLDDSSNKETLNENVEETSDNRETIQRAQSNDANNTKASNASSGQSGAASLFEQRQKQYLNGRKATKTITSNSGTVIISEGSTITDDVIEFAKENGKLIELVMNNKA